MLQITARIFKGLLIGYEVTDGYTTKQLSRTEVWKLAKDNQILNVKATGNMLSAELSGINGFELKSLPKISLDIKEDTKIQIVPYTRYDTDGYAAFIREFYTTGSIGKFFPYDRKSGKGYEDYKKTRNKLLGELIDRDTKNGVLTDTNRYIFSESIYVICDLTDSVGLNNLNLYKNSNIGSRIKNIGNQSIPYTRVTIDENHYTSEHILNPGETVCLNRLELALLASKPEISCRFQNAEMPELQCFFNFYSKGASKYALLTCFYISPYKWLFDHYYDRERTDIYNPSILKDIRTMLDEPDMSKEIIEKYFTPIDKQAQAEQKNQSQQKTTQKLKNTSSVKGIFTAFKR